MASAKHNAKALAALASLAASGRSDAIEWLVEARFSPAFASRRANPRFRTTVGLDRKPATPYEHIMGFGGVWERTGTSCDNPDIRFAATRERTFTLRVKVRCEGSVSEASFTGSWRIDDTRIVLQFLDEGKQPSAADEATCGFEAAGDGDALRCSLGKGVDYVVLPARH